MRVYTKEYLENAEAVGYPVPSCLEWNEEEQGYIDPTEVDDFDDEPYSHYDGFSDPYVVQTEIITKEQQLINHISSDMRLYMKKLFKEYSEYNEDKIWKDLQKMISQRINS